MWRTNLDNDPRSGRWLRYVAAQPNWAAKWSLVAAVLVIVVPLAVLALAGLTVGIVVFVILATIMRLASIVRVAARSVWPGGSDGGRRHVRVVDRD